MTAPVVRETFAPADAWAGRIREAWRRSVDGIFEAGRELIAAKAALAHGQFEQMVRAALPFRENTAQRLMVIAADTRLANPARAPLLPAAWTSLYELAQMSDAQLEQAFERGVVTPQADRVSLARFRKESEAGGGHNSRPLAIEGTPRQPSEAHLAAGLVAGAAAGLMAVASDVTFAELVSGERGNGVAEPRKIALYLANTGHGISQTALAAMYAMDRTNVVHAVRDIEERRSDAAGSELARLEAFLASHLAIHSPAGGPA